jgi:glycosyltransferase involved in cell wall biosynthesis
MIGWLVNDRLTCIEGTRTFWHHLLDGLPGLVDKTTGQYDGLADSVEASHSEPDYIIRNAAYFRRLDVSCPVISFVQDILKGVLRDQLVDACSASRLLVFNSDYTRAAYPELSTMPYEIIPVGTDVSVFNPRPPLHDVPRSSVLWVGSGHHVKGFDLACALSAASKRPWVFVMKDDTEVPSEYVYRRIPQELLASLASSGAVLVCTSVEETQHLAGIEAGLCGLPVVATNVGVYYGREAGAWGRIHGSDWHAEIESVANMDRGAASRYWTAHGFTLPRCLMAWRSAIYNLVGDFVVTR